MAKRKGRRRFRRYLRGAVEEVFGFGALATRDVASANFDSVVNERTYVSSLIARYSMGNFTPGVNIGPVMFGVAHSDYTDAEILEYLTQTSSWNEGDKVAQEIGRRLIRRIGVFDTPDDAADDAVLNDGKPVRTKLGWILLQGQTLNYWVFNTGSNNIATTTPAFVANGHVNLWPQ